MQSVPVEFSSCAASRPILFLFSDNDQQIPTELREQIQGILKAKSDSFPAEGVFYPKQASRPNLVSACCGQAMHAWYVVAVR